MNEDSLAIGENALEELNEDEQYFQKYDKKFNGGIEVVPNPFAQQEEEQSQHNIERTYLFTYLSYINKFIIKEKLQSKWFDREIFSDLKQDLYKNNKITHNPVKETIFQKGENLSDEDYSEDDESEGSEGDIDNQSENSEFEEYNNKANKNS